MKYFIWLFFVPLFILGQSNTIVGTITEGADSTLSNNSHVIIEQLNLSTTTDSTGSFFFKDIQNGNYTFKIEKNGYIPFESNPILIAFNGTYNLNFHLTLLPFNLGNNILSSLSQNESLYETKVSGSFYNNQDLKLSNTLDNVISKNTNSVLVYQKYFDGVFLYNGVALENNIYLDNVQLVGVNPILYTHLINTNFLSRIEVVGNNGSGFNGYPETEKINLFSNKGKNMFDVDLFTSNKKMSLSSYYNGRLNLSSALLDYINYFLSFSKTNNINRNKQDPNIDYPIGDFYNIYGTSQFVINQSQDFNLSYFFVESEQASTTTFDPFYNSFNIYSKHFNLLNINFNSTTKLGKSQNLFVSITYNKSKKHESYSFSQSNNSSTILTSLIKYNGLISSKINFNINYQNKYYITDFSNSRYFDRDHSLNLALDMQLNKLAIAPFFSLVNYDKDKFLSLPGINLAYSTSNNSKIIVNYSVGYNKRNAENSLEINYGEIQNWITFIKYRPELYKNLSFTFKYTDFDLYSIELSAYHIKYENIAKSEIRANTTFMMYKLIGYENITTNGSTILLNIAPVKNFSVSLNYTFQDIKDSQSNNLRLRPHHSAFATINYKNNNLGINAAIELRYYGYKFASDGYAGNSNFNLYESNRRDLKTSDALVSNAYFEKEFTSGLSLTIGAYNIFDRKTANYCSYQTAEYFLKINYSL